jgi:hypothetical protein
MTSNEERSNNYAKVVKQIDGTCRIIEGKHGLQWILQKRLKDRWRSYGYPRTRHGVLRALTEKIDQRPHYPKTVAERIVGALPERI